MNQIFGLNFAIIAKSTPVTLRLPTGFIKGERGGTIRIHLSSLLPPLAEPWFCPACTAAPAQPLFSRAGVTVVHTSHHCRPRLEPLLPPPALPPPCLCPKPPPPPCACPGSVLLPLQCSSVPWSTAREPWFVYVQGHHCSFLSHRQ